MMRHLLARYFPPFVVLCLPSTGWAIGLDEYLSQVEASNPQVKASDLRADAASHRTRPERTWSDPFVAAGPDEISDGKVGVMRYQVSQTIPFPGRLSAKGKAAESRAEVARAGAATDRRRLRVDAIQLFCRAYLVDRSLELNRQSQELLRQMVASTKARYTTGGSGHHDWLISRVELDLLSVEKLRLERDRSSAVAVLNELRDRSPDTPIDALTIDFESPTWNAEGDSKESLAEQPELQLLAAGVRTAEADRSMAKLSYLPDFTIQGMLMQPRMRDEGAGMRESNWGLMVGVNLPLYFFRKQSELVTAANLELEATSAEERALRRRLESERVMARQQLQTALDTEKLYRESILPATELALRNSRSEYAARRQPIGSFLESVRIRRTQEVEYAAARVDVLLSRVRIREVLSSPPVLRLTPSRPSLFGSASSMTGGMSSETVSMGSGMSGPTRKETKSKAVTSPGAGGSGMGGM